MAIAQETEQTHDEESSNQIPLVEKRGTILGRLALPNQASLLGTRQIGLELQGFEQTSEISADDITQRREE